MPRCVAGFTLRLALAVVVPLISLAVTTLDVVAYAPALGAMTLTLTVQLAPEIVPPLKVMLALPAAAPMVGEPQPLVFRPFGEAMTIAPGVVGSESLKPTPVSGVEAFGLLIVKVSVEGLPSATVAGEKAALIVGALNWYSYAPMSHTPPCGRAVPTSSVEGQIEFVPPLMAALPASSG